MHKIEDNPVYRYYFPLLFRFARMIVKDHEAAVAIASTVLKDQYCLDGLQESLVLRGLLKTDTLHRCACHKQVNIFDKPLIKIPFH